MANDPTTRASAQMLALLREALNTGARVHVSGTSAAVFAQCSVDRIEGERVWLTPANYPGAYSPRIAELVMVSVVGGKTVTRARGKSRPTPKSVGGALEGVRKLSVHTLTPAERRAVSRAIVLLGSIATEDTGEELERVEKLPKKAPRKKARPAGVDTPMLPL